MCGRTEDPKEREEELLRAQVCCVRMTLKVGKKRFVEQEDTKRGSVLKHAKVS